MHSARAGRVTQAARFRHRLPQRILGRHVGVRRAGANRDRHTERTKSTLLPATT
jgi:hypothetical protein